PSAGACPAVLTQCGFRTKATQVPACLRDALRDGLAAPREYGRLVSRGTCHDRALGAALSETSRSREACAGERRREKKTPARLDQRLLREIGITRIGFSPRSG